MLHVIRELGKQCSEEYSLESVPELCWAGTQYTQSLARDLQKGPSEVAIVEEYRKGTGGNKW